MVVIAIIAILTALAAPSFRPIIEKWRIRDAADNFTSTMYLAKTEAIKRGGSVVVEKNPLTTQDCPNATDIADWGCGWFVYVDVNRNDKFDAATDVVLQKSPPLKALNFTTRPAKKAYVIDRWGKAGAIGAGSSFLISPVPAGVSSPYVTTLCVSSGGRALRLDGDVVCP